MELVTPGSRGSRRETLAAAQLAGQELRERHIRGSERIARAMLELQSEAGYWCGELTADSTLESDYILLQMWLYPPEPDQEWMPPSRRRVDRAVTAILERQQPDGGWWIYRGGGAEINATARAYTMLKMCGMDTDAEPMRKAREKVLELGGLQACNSYTKINFSLFDLYPRKYVPSVPPEIVLAPGDLIYEMSSWTRAIIVPLSIVQAVGKHKPTPMGRRVDELLAPHKKLSLPKRDAVSLIFTQVDRAVKIWERRNLRNVRAKAIREAERWMLERTRYSDGLGAIYPSMMYLIMALESMGYASDQPDLVEGIRQFENLLIETGERFQFQPCVSPVWDTAICAYALGELEAKRPGAADQAKMTRAADWLLTKEVRRKGDWSVKRPDLEPSGWAFEFANEYYPDIDDTAMVLLALRHAKASDAGRQARVEKRAVNWLLGMQGSDGGWAAFDVDNNWSLLNKVPFADHNAMLDPACPDITGRVLDALSKMGLGPEHPAVARGVEFLLRNQERDGSWYGRWGVNYIYGTFLALRGLRASGVPGTRTAVERASEWLRSIQNPDGGWGESCLGYKTHGYVQAPSTPSQTAWAMLGLEAAGLAQLPAVKRGVRWLLERQKADGRWDEDLMTGTGFPNVFYLSYHLYRDYFPLLALATLCPSAVKAE
ncbi:MAG: squalene--hopene cyclase [Candidatus Solibacter sp.]|nr:squalene--hopene cyclase [Candidatus Solibacter sp.]